MKDKRTKGNYRIVSGYASNRCVFIERSRTAFHMHTNAPFDQLIQSLDGYSYPMRWNFVYTCMESLLLRAQDSKADRTYQKKPGLRAYADGCSLDIFFK